MINWANSISLLVKNALLESREDLRLKYKNIRKYITSLKKVRYGRNNDLKGKVVAISRDIEIADDCVWKPVVQKIVLSGGEYTAKIGKCNLYISTQNTSDSSLARERYLNLRTQNGEEILVLDREAFLQSQEDTNEQTIG